MLGDKDKEALTKYKQDLSLLNVVDDWVGVKTEKFLRKKNIQNYCCRMEVRRRDGKTKPELLGEEQAVICM